MSKQTHIKPEELLLYAVTDRHWLNGATLISQVEAALKGEQPLSSFVKKIWMIKHFIRKLLRSRNYAKNIRCRL